jgi:hypothetical protein
VIDLVVFGSFICFCCIDYGMFGEPDTRGGSVKRQCNHCGDYYTHVYADDESDGSYCDLCVEKYTSFERIAQVMNYDQSQLDMLSELIEGEPYALWIDAHPQRAYLFDKRTVDWDVEEFHSVRS